MNVRELKLLLLDFDDDLVLLVRCWDDEGERGMTRDIRISTDDGWKNRLLVDVFRDEDDDVCGEEIVSERAELVRCPECGQESCSAFQCMDNKSEECVATVLRPRHCATHDLLPIYPSDGMCTEGRKAAKRI